MSDVEEDVFVTVRMPRSLRESLEATARGADRTLIAEIRMACRNWLRGSTDAPFTEDDTE